MRRFISLEALALAAGASALACSTAAEGDPEGAVGSVSTAAAGGEGVAGATPSGGGAGGKSGGGGAGDASDAGSGGTLSGVGGTAGTGGNTSAIGGGGSNQGGSGPSAGGAGGSSTNGGSGGADGDFWGGLKNPPVKSAGCGKAAAITTGEKTIMSSGRQRQYMIDVPENYDPEKPYRLFYASHGLGGEDEHVATWWNYFGLKTQAEAANEPAIFIAPQAIERWDETDHALFDDVTDLAKESLCVDTSRVFVTGMSFGGMITYSLSTNHQKRFRAGVALAPANYNIWLPDTKAQDPIAWMQTTGMSDNTCPWVNNEAAMTGSKFIALEKAADNGCTIPDEIETWDQNHPTRHICIDLEGCKTGYPVKVCTFNGAHWQFPYDEGNGEDLDRSWVPVEAWKFFMQF